MSMINTFKKFVLLSVALVLSLAAATAVMTSAAEAKNRCIDEVCAAFLNQEIRSLRQEIQDLKRQRVTVGTAKTAKASVAAVNKKKAQVVNNKGGGQVCWYVQAKNMSSVIVYEGTYQRRGAVIASFGSKGWFKKNGKLYKQLCVLRASIASLNRIAICNDNGHNEFARVDIETVLRRGNVGLDDVAKLYKRGGN